MTESLQEIERLIKRYKASPDLWDEALMFIEVMSAITRVVQERDAAVAHVARLTGDQDWWKDPWVPVTITAINKTTARIAVLEARIKHLTEYHFTDVGIPPTTNNAERVDIIEPESNEMEATADEFEKAANELDAALSPAERKPRG